MWSSPSGGGESELRALGGRGDAFSSPTSSQATPSSVRSVGHGDRCPGIPGDGRRHDRHLGQAFESISTVFGVESHPLGGGTDAEVVGDRIGRQRPGEASWGGRRSLSSGRQRGGRRPVSVGRPAARKRLESMSPAAWRSRRVRRPTICSPPIMSRTDFTEWPLVPTVVRTRHWSLRIRTSSPGGSGTG